MVRMPVLFVSHGAPNLVLEPGAVGRAWQQIVAGFPKPKSILCISAHWETADPTISMAKQPETIHDFFGFEPALSEIHYPAPGAPDMAEEAISLAAGAGVDIHQDPDRGLDHGAWAPLTILYPEADIPVAQLSVQPGLGLDAHFTLGRGLAPLAQKGVLILASGSLTHNLRDLGNHFRNRHGEPVEYAQQFDRWVSEKVLAGNWDCLLHMGYAPHFERNHPTPEHILPLLVAAGAARGPGRSFSELFDYRILSMKGFIFD